MKINRVEDAKVFGFNHLFQGLPDFFEYHFPFCSVINNISLI